MQQLPRNSIVLTAPQFIKLRAVQGSVGAWMNHQRARKTNRPRRVGQFAERLGHIRNQTITRKLGLAIVRIDAPLLHRMHIPPIVVAAVGGEPAVLINVAVFE